jgi:transposase
MIRIEFSEAAINELRKERYHHPHPRVQRKMEALLLKSQGLSHGMIGTIVGVTQKTLREYLEDYQSGGIEKLKEIKFYRPQSELSNHIVKIEELFRETPPATIKEAASKIKEITGIERSEDRVRLFLKKNRAETLENRAYTGKSRYRKAD